MNRQFCRSQPFQPIEYKAVMEISRPPLGVYLGSTMVYIGESYVKPKKMGTDHD
jgi:hypothetical protein